MNDKIEFREGDIVELKSGGPPMTIARLADNNSFATCVWFVPEAEWQGAFEKVFKISTLKQGTETQ